MNINQLLENSFWADGIVTGNPVLNQFVPMSRVTFGLDITDSDQHVAGVITVEAWKKNEEIDAFLVLNPGQKVHVEGFISPQVYKDKTGMEQVRITYLVSSFNIIEEDK